ncbi:hypothetical protein V1264_008780 [Littorina saxatilis]|uniref:Uncharacterized protein n=1 Tax=Littorina saxatilis TaxID=31220 RepID=A0AAN9ATT4_9CAEN
MMFLRYPLSHRGAPVTRAWNLQTANAAKTAAVLTWTKGDNRIMQQRSEVDRKRFEFKVMLNKVNGALVDASLVEPIFRKMESLREDVQSLTRKAPDEEAWALEDSSHLVSLRDEVASELKKLKTLYGKVKRAMHAGCEWKTTHFDDASLNVKLRARQHLLERKARQAERFYRRSVNMVKCVPLSLQPRNHT